MMTKKYQDSVEAPVQLKGVSAFWLNWENPKYAESKAAMQYMRDNWKMMALRAPMGTGASGGYTTSDANKTALFDWMKTNDISGTAWKLAAGKNSSKYFTTAPPVDGPSPTVCSAKPTAPRRDTASSSSTGCVSTPHHPPPLTAQ
jgi:hypothetical protein